MPVYVILKMKNVHQNFFTQNKAWKLGAGSFKFRHNGAQPLMKNEILETSWLHWIGNCKTIKICQNHHADFLRYLFTFLSTTMVTYCGELHKNAMLIDLFLRNNMPWK